MSWFARKDGPGGLQSGSAPVATRSRAATGRRGMTSYAQTLRRQAEQRREEAGGQQSGSWFAGLGGLKGGACKGDIPALEALAAMGRPALAALCGEHGHVDPDQLDRGDCVLFLLIARERGARAGRAPAAAPAGDSAAGSSGYRHAMALAPQRCSGGGAHPQPQAQGSQSPPAPGLRSPLPPPTSPDPPQPPAAAVPNGSPTAAPRPRASLEPLCPAEAQDAAAAGRARASPHSPPDTKTQPPPPPPQAGQPSPSGEAPAGNPLLVPPAARPSRRVSGPAAPSQPPDGMVGNSPPQPAPSPPEPRASAVPSRSTSSAALLPPPPPRLPAAGRSTQAGAKGGAGTTDDWLAVCAPPTSPDPMAEDPLGVCLSSLASSLARRDVDGGSPGPAAAAAPPARDSVPRGLRLDELTMQDVERLELAFEDLDMDRTGTLDFIELHNLWRAAFGDSLSEDEVDRVCGFIFADIDQDGDQEVCWAELKEYLCGVYEDPDEEEIAMVVGLSGFIRVDRPATWRHWLWAVMDEPVSEYYRVPMLQKCAMLVSMVVQLVIVIATVNLVVDSHPDTDVEQTGLVEYFCSVFFAVELLLRVIACPCTVSPSDRRVLISQRHFWTMGFTWVDVLAVLPWYLVRIGVMPEGNGGRLHFVRVVRLVRLARVLRIFKAGRRSAAIQLLMIALKRCWMAISWMCILLLMSTVLFASMMFYAEQQDANLLRAQSGENVWIRHNTSKLHDAGKQIPFQSILDAMWWAIQTLTTGGYGDIVPYTDVGRAVASLCMVTNLLLNSYPITIICITFGDVWAAYTRGMTRKMRRKRLLFAAELDGVDDGKAQGKAQALRRKASDVRHLRSLERATSHPTTEGLNCGADPKPVWSAAPAGLPAAVAVDRSKAP